MKAKIKQPQPIDGGPVADLTPEKIRQIAAASGSKTYSEIILKRYGLEPNESCDDTPSKAKP